MIKIRSFLILFIISLVLLLVPTKINAQTPTLTPREAATQRIEERRELRETRRQELQERIEERRATVSARLQEVRQQRIRLFFDRMVQRMNAVIERLNLLIERIESRLAKIEEGDEEIDTESIQADLDEAKELLDEAQASLDAAEGSLEEVLETGDPKAAFALIRETILGVKQNLIEVHRLLVSVIGDIKGLRVGQQ